MKSAGSQVRSSRIRAFVAVDVSPETHAALVGLKAELAATKADVRWVRDGGLHCTLKFLGGVDGARLDLVHQRLEEALSACAAVDVMAETIAVFPSPRRPRVVWVGLTGGGLSRLAEVVETALEPLGFSREARPFTAHVTLGRVNGRGGWAAVEQVMQAHAGQQFGATCVDRVVIYRSDLRPGGAVYSPLWTIALRESSLS